MVYPLPRKAACVYDLGGSVDARVSHDLPAEDNTYMT